MGEKKVLNDTQERFLKAVEMQVPVRVFLKSGAKLQGVIVGGDNYGIAFLHRTKKGAEEVYIFKSSILYIEPLQKIKLPKFQEKKSSQFS